MAKYTSIAMKQQKTSKVTTTPIQRLTTNRNNQVNDCIKKTTRYIVNQCISSGIGTFIVGSNTDLPRSVHIGNLHSPTSTH